MKNNSLCEQLPYWEFEDSPASHLILWDGSVSTGIELLPLDIECFDASRINALTEGLRVFLNSLPDGLMAQFIVKLESDFASVIDEHERISLASNKFLKIVDSKRIHSIREQVLEEKIFRPRLFFSLRAINNDKPRSLSGTKKFSAEFAKGYNERLQTLLQSIENASSQFSSLGFTSTALSKENLVELIYRHLNPNRSHTVQPPEIRLPKDNIENESPRSRLVFGDLVLDQEEFILDKTRTRVFSLKSLPETTFAGMMSGFLSFDFKYELIFSFNIQEQSKEMKLLEQKRRMAHALTANTNGKVSDLEGESRLTQTTDLIREIIESGQKIFEAELLIILREKNSTDGEKQLNLKSKEILSKFRTLSGAEGVQETVSSWKVFSKTLPLAPIELIRKKKMKTNNLADFLPIYGGAKGDEIPIVLTHTKYDSLYSINPYDPKLTNYNMLVTGSSGSGKSFASNFFLLQQLARGTKTFIIDIGGSYKKLCELLDGQYFEINLLEKYSINPFELQNPSVMPSGEKIKGLVSIVEQMVVDQGEKLSRFDRVLIEEALTHVYESVLSERKNRSPQISDLQKYCRESKEDSLKKIAKLLFPWVGNTPYGKLIDRPGKISSDSSIVAFDLKGLSSHPDLQSVMILILTNFIIDQVENDRSSPKRVLLDESWALLQSPAASSFMEYAARTFRKTGSGITFITQGVEEIIQSPIGSAILNNTATKLVMLQKGNINVLADALKLNNQELRIIQSLKRLKGVYSEGFLMSGDHRLVIRISPSPLEYWISTSDAADNQYLNRLMDEGLSLQEAVKQAAEIAPFGIGNQKSLEAA